MISNARIRLVFVVLIALALAIQIQSLVRTSALPTAKSAWNMRGQPAWERSATMLVGQEFAEYIRFLRNHTPADARIILPPRSLDRPVEHVGLMQYFLFPREILNCGANEVEACILRVTGPNTYILSVEGFPPMDLAKLSKHYVQFEDELGVYAPRPNAETDQ